MPEAKIENFIVRILDQENVPVGAGCLISSRYILTCAHVVSKLRKEIEFSFLLFPEKKYKAYKKDLFSPGEKASFGDSNDIAVLELTSGEELPDDVNLDPEYDFKFSRNCSVRVCGFPKGFDDGDWVGGILMGSIGKGLVQFDHEIQSKFVAPGFSGAPVWDKCTDAFVGMVVSTGKRGDKTSVYMIPTATLAKAWPELGSKAEDVRETKSSVGRFVHKMCNRGKQVGDF